MELWLCYIDGWHFRIERFMEVGAFTEDEVERMKGGETLRKGGKEYSMIPNKPLRYIR